MEVKGAVVHTIPFFIKTKFGEQGYQKWIRSVSDNARIEFIKGIDNSAWYPVNEFLIEPSLKFCDMFYKGKLDGVVEQGRYSAEQALKGVAGIFVKLGSPGTIIKKASQIITNYYKPSSIEVIDNGNKNVSVKISKFDDPNIIIEARIKGWIERGLELSGVKSPEAKIKTSMCSGSPYTEYIITWI